MLREALVNSGLGHPLSFSFRVATSASTTHSSSHWATQHKKCQPTGDIYIHAPKQRLTSLHSNDHPHCGVWHGMPVGNVVHTLPIRGAVYCSKVQQLCQPQGYRGVWHDVPMGNVGPLSLLWVPGTDQNSG